MKKWIWVTLGLPSQLIFWGLQMAVKTVVAALGLVVVPFLYRYRWDDIKATPSWAKPWVNPEDWTGGRQGYAGSLPTWWTAGNGDGRYSFWKYHAVRNPADGLRNFPKWNLQINPDKVYYWTPEYFRFYEPWHIKKPGVYGYVCWQTVWLGVKVQWIRKETYSEFKLGFRVEPSDAHGHLDPNGSRAKDGASFASKLILNRDWN